MKTGPAQASAPSFTHVNIPAAPDISRVVIKSIRNLFLLFLKNCTPLFLSNHHRAETAPLNLH